MPRIKNLNCCGIEQEAHFIQLAVPTDIRLLYPEIEDYYIAYIKECKHSKCPTGGRLARIGITFSKEVIMLPGKRKYLPLYKQEALRFPAFIEIESFKETIDNRFYLLCNIYGNITPCYSNLSTLKLGLIPGEEDEQERIARFNKVILDGMIWGRYL
jgi:hypothetical protein